MRVLPLLAAFGLPLLAAFGLAACAMVDGTPPAVALPPEPIPVATAPELLARRLPAEAASFRRGATTPVRQPSPGVEVAYATNGRTAAGFVQVLRPPGEDALPDGIESAAAQAEYQRSIAEAVRGAGQHRRLRVIAEVNHPENNPLFHCAEMEGTYGRQAVQSMTCVGGAGGQLLRIRVSMPQHEPALADPRAFLRDITAALRAP
ncbi:MAG: hypothetical protein JWR10_4376 [Rubritepida sp.]|nr:hypothetical protein [Rubritepida sp.]